MIAVRSIDDLMLLLGEETDDTELSRRDTANKETHTTPASTAAAGLPGVYAGPSFRLKKKSFGGPGNDCHFNAGVMVVCKPTVEVSRRMLCY